MLIDELQRWWEALTPEQRAEALTFTRHDPPPAWLATTLGQHGILGTFDAGWSAAGTMQSFVAAAVLDFVREQRRV